MASPKQLPLKNPIENDFVPRLSDFMDYRVYLLAWIAWKKRHNPKYSLRKFALAAGIPKNNSTFISRVLAGKRDLTSEATLCIASALGLENESLQHFELLVRYNQAASQRPKEMLFAEFIRRRPTPIRVLNGDSAAFYYRDWRLALVRAFVGLRPTEKRPAVIGKHLYPPLPGPDVTNALRELLAMDLIRKGANGFILTDTHISLPEGAYDPARTRILAMMELALNALAEVPASHRDYSTMTVTLTYQGLQTIKERMKTWREEIRRIAAQEENADRIYTLNLQLFPNTDWKIGEKRK